jgi:lipopolysaccharide exporter
MIEGRAESRKLTIKALGGLFWSYGAHLSGRLVFFAATLVLARLLEPADFGVVTFALAILAYASNVLSHGATETLVYRHDAHDPRVASTVHWLACGAAIVLVAAVWLTAPLFADVSDDSSATWVLRILSLQLLMTAAVTVNGALIRHSLDFRKLFLPEQTGGLARGAVAIVLAIRGAGAWSLVAGQLCGIAATSLLLWIVGAWRPVRAFAREEVPRILRTGAGFTAIAILGEATRNVDFLIVGARLGTEQLGYYTLAFRLPELAVLALFEVAWGVLFPYYSRLRESSEAPEDLTRRYLRTVRLGSLLAFPMAAALAGLAAPLVLILYGDKWEPSVVPLALVALWAGLAAVTGMPGTLLKSQGRTGLLTATLVFYLGTLIPSLWFAAGSGINAVAGAHVGVQVAYLLFLSGVVVHAFEIRWVETLIAVFPGLVIAAGVGAALFVLAEFVPAALAVAAGVPCGLGLYALGLRLIAREDFHALRSLVGELRASRG